MATSQPTALQLPFLGGIGYYRFSTTIDGASYLFDVRWNSRDAAWYFDVLEADETPIAHGLKLVLGCYIGRRLPHPLVRDGVLVAVDLSGAAREATFDDLGTRVVVEWIPVLELIRRLRETSA